MSIAAPPALVEADYDAIEAAVMETARGRWFLAEYARRHRHADTVMLVDAMARLENVVRSESLSSVERVRGGLMEMSGAIARAKEEIAAIKPEGETGRIEEATEELDSVVSATETATGEILAAAEQIQEIAWTLRERDLAAGFCDDLDARATDIYTACSFQDLTGQRTRKVIGVLRFLESRLDAMIALWGGQPAAEAAAAPPGAKTGEAALLNGPARPGQGLLQDDIDLMMIDVPEDLVLEPVIPEHECFGSLEDAAGTFVEIAAVEVVTWEDSEGDAARAPAPATDDAEDDPLRPLAALSREEKVALFS